jgi:uncharacterized protein YkwD
MGRPNWYYGRHPPTCTCHKCARKSHRSRRNRFSWAKFFLVILAIVCSLAVLCTAYLLYAHKIDLFATIIVLAATIATLIWTSRLLGRYRVGSGAVFGVFVVAALVVGVICAFAGLEPMSSYKDQLAQLASQSWQVITNPSQPSIPVSVEQAPAPSKPPPTTNPQPSPSEQVPTSAPQPSRLSILELEQETFRLINVERERAGVPATMWDEELYKLSKSHTEEMANRGELFHTPMNASYGENCWGGQGYYNYSGQELARVIVDSWMTSPLHRDWLLHKPIRTSVVSIVLKPGGQYASWTFWTREVGEGPPLVREIAEEWQRETGGNIPWLEWLKMKGYIKGGM